MSWASHRRTSRIEDEAYCLLGLFGVNMPLLFGEGVGAFRRLQEEILARGEDQSLFAWSRFCIEEFTVDASHSILAPAPRAFQGCNDIRKGFATQRILFEVTSRGMLVLIHRSLDQDTVDRLLHFASVFSESQTGWSSFQLGLMIPLSCFRVVSDLESGEKQADDLFLQLVLDRGLWRRVGISQHRNGFPLARYAGMHSAVYSNDYIRLYIRHEPASRTTWGELSERAESSLTFQPLHNLRLRDIYFRDSL